MPVLPGRSGVTLLRGSAAFARPSGRLQGNQLPPQTGYSLDLNPTERTAPGSMMPGYDVDGHVGVNDGNWGADPTRPKITAPVFLPGQDPAGMDSPNGRPEQSWWRGGLQGFSDKLTVTDRHAFWWKGADQKQGTDFSAASSPPNTYNNPLQQSPQARLRTVNRRWSYQKGTDTTRNQDDLTRAYTWLGEQGSGWAPIYGGVPGLYQPYGTRGGVPYAIVDPTNGDGGPEKVWAGPPHGLHSLTYPGTGDTLSMYGSRPQMRPVRLDRPSNSPQAGQSYSQTVAFQGQEPRGAGMPRRQNLGGPGGRGWAGAG